MSVIRLSGAGGDPEQEDCSKLENRKVRGGERPGPRGQAQLNRVEVPPSTSHFLHAENVASSSIKQGSLEWFMQYPIKMTAD